MSKKIILFVDPMSYNNLALYDHNLISNIKGVKVIFICNYAYNLPEPSLTYRFFSYQKYSSLLKPLSYIFSMLKILFFARKNRVNAVHFQWFKIPYFDYIIIKILKRCKIKVVYTAHNVLPHDSGVKYKFIYGLIYRCVDNIVCHTNYAKSQLENLFKLLNITVIPHGLLDLNAFNDKETIGMDFSSQLKEKKGITFSFIGNISSYKGIDIVVDAWLSSEILKSSNATLLISGGGTIPKMKDLNQCGNVVVFNRLLTNPEFLLCIRYSDYILMPYRAISQSGLLLTALANDRRIIVSNLPPLLEPFEFISKDLGYVLKENTSEALKELMEQIFSENIHQLPLAPTIVKKIHEYYDWENIGAKTSLLYEKL